MYLRGLLLSGPVLMLGLCPLMAARITYTISGGLGPVLSGSDPAGANGQSAVLTAAVNAALRPESHTAATATYTLPAGALKLKCFGGSFVTTRTSTLKYTFPAAGLDQMVLTATFLLADTTFPVVLAASLANGSFTTAVKTHPQKFTPTPQTLAPAKSASGAGSEFKYTLFGNGTTLGVGGTASN